MPDDENNALESNIAGFFDTTIGGTGSGARTVVPEETDDTAGDERDDDEQEESDDDAEQEDADESDDDDQDDDDDSDDEEDGSDDADDDDEGNDEDEEEGDEEDDDDDVPDPEVRAAAERHQLPTRFEDIVKKLPKGVRAEARQAFHQRLKEVESGLGRAFQEARAERKTLARLEAERKHEQAHPVDFIADLLDTKPELLDQLNEELTKRETAAYRDAKKMTRDLAKKELERTVDQEATARESRRQRGQQVAMLASRLAREEGVPFKIIDQAIYIAVSNSPEKDITDEAIRQIIKREAKDWRKLTGERKREKKQEYIQRKSKQIRDGRRRVTSRDRGSAPAPGRRREPKSLEEALTIRARKILPDAPG